jgi:AraC family transcriptional regulator, regulatory protein of adaptative response / methylated-DNA-[protein]-cysteine methyltransferase
MNLMISEHVSLPMLKRTCVNGSTETISYAMSACALGELLVARSAKGICAILISSDENELKGELAVCFPKADSHDE